MTCSDGARVGGLTAAWEGQGRIGVEVGVKRWQVIAVGLLVSGALLLVGNLRNEIIEIHNDGATMCLECIGLE